MAAGSVVFRCSRKTGTSLFSREYTDVTLTPRPDGVLDYSSAWEGGYLDCETENTIRPETDLEKHVYDLSETTYGKGLTYAYGSCTENNSDDVASSGHIPSKGQVPERSAALALCPDHPFAEVWARGLQLAQPGNSFEDGTHVVGKDIQPGTYAIDTPGKAATGNARTTPAGSKTTTSSTRRLAWRSPSAPPTMGSCQRDAAPGSMQPHDAKLAATGKSRVSISQFVGLV